MNDRPRRYLRERLRNAPDIPRPCLIPRMFTQRELMAAFRQARHPGPRREAGKLDQVALLSHCVRELAHPGTDLCVQLSKTDEAGFFPWGVRLADLLEECFSHGLTPDDMLYAEGEVAPFGAALLGSLGAIFARYREALLEAGFTTPGFDAFMVASTLREERVMGENQPLPGFLAGRAVLLAGFGTLTGSEDILFRHLWEQGAQVFLHADPALAGDGRPHWSCAGHAEWIAGWQAETQLACPPSGRKPKIHYFAGYDLHSQLDALRRDLLALEERDRLAAAAKARPPLRQLSLLSGEAGCADPAGETSPARTAQEPSGGQAGHRTDQRKAVDGGAADALSEPDAAPLLPTSQLDIAVSLAHSGALLDRKSVV